MSNPEFNPKFLLERAELLLQSGEYCSAIEIFQQILASDVNSIAANYGIALSYQKLESVELAIQHYQKVITLAPHIPEPYNNIASIFIESKNFTQAITQLNAAIKANPNFSMAYYNLAKAHSGINNHLKAIEFYKISTNLAPEYIPSYNNLGNIYFYLKKYKDAINCFEKIININPRYSKGYYNLGNIYNTTREYAKAVKSYQQAVNISPNYHEALAQLYYCKRMTCDWHDIDKIEYRLDKLTNQCIKENKCCPEPPLINITRTDCLQQNFHVARLHLNLFSNPKFKFKKISGKIKIGYLSNDFYNHATMHLISKIFTYHNYDKFEIHLFSYGEVDDSCYLKNLKQKPLSMHDLNAKSDEQIAEYIHKHKIQILIDLKGHTQGNRISILNFRPAPIQITYLGFPGTTGLEAIDYVLTDKIVTPTYMAQYYSEKFIYLDNCYQVNDDEHSISEHKYTRQELGLPQDHVIFCSFNQSYKFDREMYMVWMNIINKVPNSVLWLLEDNIEMKQNLLNIANQYGVKVIFAPKLAKAEHLARLQLADLCLDTRLYNGHTTTSDAIRAGIPVITLQGKHFASRVSASILSHINLHECITNSIEEYMKLAIDLATNKDNITKLKQKVSNNKQLFSLYKTDAFTKNLESIYVDLINLHLH